MPKSQINTKPAVAVESNANGKPRSRWEIWVAKNALPKKHNYSKPKPQPTRFQKPGPMTATDNKRFLRWAKKRSLPKQVCQQPQVEKPKKKIRFKQRHQKTKASMCRIQCLSTPKWPREKYVPAPQPNYPYSPKIHHFKPPHRDRGRPFQNIKLPHWWYHEELEIDFWRWMRFPIRRRALKYKISWNINRLACPKTYHVKPHCPYPPRDYSPPDRVRMNPIQWREHLKRLAYLADASFKVKRQFKAKEEDV